MINEDAEDPDDVAPITTATVIYPDGHREVWEDGELVEVWPGDEVT